MEAWTDDDWTDWVEKTYEALDGKDADGFVAQLTPGATVRFGNGDPVVGRVAIRDAFEEFFAAIGGVSHAFTGQWRDGTTLCIEAEATYTRADGTTVVLPAATVLELNEGLAERVQVYVDASPLFTQREAPALCRAAVPAVSAG